MFSSFKNRQGLTGGNITEGHGVHTGEKWNWNWQKVLREMGIPEDKWKDVNTTLKTAESVVERGNEDAKKAIDQYSGYIYKAFKGDGSGVLEEEVPVTFGDRTYQVGKEGIKLVNEKFLLEVTREALERQAYIDEVADLMYNVGNMAVLIINSNLLAKMKEVGCMPSQVKHETNDSQFGAKFLAMKNLIAEYIDKCHIPESALAELRKYASKGSHSETVKIKQNTGVDSKVAEPAL